jgi:hypothetical protein
VFGIVACTNNIKRCAYCKEGFKNRQAVHRHHKKCIEKLKQTETPMSSPSLLTKDRKCTRKSVIASLLVPTAALPKIVEVDQGESPYPFDLVDTPGPVDSPVPVPLTINCKFESG